MIDIDVQKGLGSFKIDAKIKTDTNGVIALFGRSGSGKTSLVNMIAGLTRPDSGRIVIGNEPLFDNARGIDVAPEHRRLGYVFQEDRLFPHMSVIANLHYGAPRGAAGRQFNRIVDLLGIRHLLKRRPTTLSGGEKQRVAIGRALLADPRLILMDEPLASLDSARKDEILPFIEELSSELGMPIIYVSHTMDEIIRLADTLVLMSDGRIEALGTVEALTSRLDLRPMTGRYEAGSVLHATIAHHNIEQGLTYLSFNNNTFKVPLLELPRGRELRIRIRARDVSIALTAPQDISILNVFPGTITEIDEDASLQVDVLIDIGVPIWARISRHSLSMLDLHPGKKTYVLIKAIAINRYSLGGLTRSGMSTND